MGDGFQEGFEPGPQGLSQWDLSTGEGRRALFEAGGIGWATVVNLGELDQQAGWNDYEAVTPNLSEKGIRRVDQHIGFDAAWELLAPLLVQAEAKLEELAQYRQMLLDAGDLQWDGKLVAADIGHILRGVEPPAQNPEAKGAAPVDPVSLMSRGAMALHYKQQAIESAQYLKANSEHSPSSR